MVLLPKADTISYALALIHELSHGPMNFTVSDLRELSRLRDRQTATGSISLCAVRRLAREELRARKHWGLVDAVRSWFVPSDDLG